MRLLSEQPVETFFDENSKTSHTACRHYSDKYVTSIESVILMYVRTYS